MASELSSIKDWEIFWNKIEEALIELNVDQKDIYKFIDNLMIFLPEDKVKVPDDAFCDIQECILIHADNSNITEEKAREEIIKQPGHMMVINGYLDKVRVKKPPGKKQPDHVIILAAIAFRDLEGRLPTAMDGSKCLPPGSHSWSSVIDGIQKEDRTLGKMIEEHEARLASIHSDATPSSDFSHAAISGQKEGGKNIPASNFDRDAYRRDFI